jgi:exodeoxyribonuclease V gamma subunit
VHRGTLIDAVYSTLGPKHRLRAWVRLLALAAAVPDESWTAVTVGRHEGPRPRARVSTLSAPPARDAATLLAALVAVHVAALTEPLPLPLAPACAYARSRHAGHGVEAALDDAARQWQGFSGPGDAYHRLVWGDGAAFRGVVAQPPDRASGVWPGESTRFGALARTVWDALLAHESTAVA